jgi:hypothetical protein
MLHDVRHTAWWAGDTDSVLLAGQAVGSWALTRLQPVLAQHERRSCLFHSSCIYTNPQDLLWKQLPGQLCLDHMECWQSHRRVGAGPVVLLVARLLHRTYSAAISMSR